MLVNIYLLLFYGFYIILLSRETFFQLNRVYLVAAALLSFFIPLIQAEWVKNLFITKQVNFTIYTSPVMFYRFSAVEDKHITIGQVLAIVYFAGIVFLAGRLIWQLVALKKIIDQPQSSAAYSFFKKIRLGSELENNRVIAAHENVHASQWHSADVLLIEAVMIINWFNPVVYLYRFAVKHIHEFIADRQAIKAGTNKEAYALLLLSQTFNMPAHNLVNPFYNQSLLKQRILMLQKSNSRGVALIKYCLSAPLFILMLILSSATVNNSKTVRLFNKKAEQVFLIPAATAVNKDVTTATTSGSNKQYLLSSADTVPSQNNKVYTLVDLVPEFPGGLQAFGQFLGNNIKYPAEERRKGIQGKVIVSFIVEEDGSLSNIHIVRSVAKGIDDESIRVLKLSPKWTPGKQNGNSVRTTYSVPIAFTLDDVKPAQPPINKTGAVNEKNTSNASPALATAGTSKADTGKNAPVIQLTSSFPNAPLYILDGKEVSDISKLKLISPDDIKSVAVFKNKQATDLYGSKGINGVIVITSKDH